MSPEPTQRQERITELATLLIDQADEQAQRKDLAEKQRKVLEGADLASLDQLIASVTDRAKVVAAYYGALCDGGVDSDEAGWLARDEADRMREAAE